MNTRGKLGFVIATVLICGLSGCQSSQERARIRSERQAQVCRDKGLEEGSEAFDACRMRQREEARKREDERMDFDDHFRPAPEPTKAYSW